MDNKTILRDIKKAAATLSVDEARYLVRLYYQMQEYRKAAYNQCRSIGEDPHETLSYFGGRFESDEKDIKAALQKYVEAQPIGQWLMSITGIGPVISAGLIAHIDIDKVCTAGQVQAYAGLDPTKEWKKGQKRPFNADLKRLCFLAGECFIKVSNNENDVYGKLYKIRKEYENEKNARLEYQEQAEHILATKNIGKNTEAYKWYSQGMLPPAHIHSRARRYAVKIFLSHLFSVWYEMVHGEKPPKPYAIAILNHAHEIPIPNWPMAVKKAA